MVHFRNIIFSVFPEFGSYLLNLSNSLFLHYLKKSDHDLIWTPRSIVHRFFKYLFDWDGYENSSGNQFEVAILLNVVRIRFCNGMDFNSQ